VKIAILGRGKQGMKHLRAFQTLPAVERVLTADIDPARAGELDPDAAIDAADGVVIATPTTTHDGLLRRALDAGKPVLCEKPLVAPVAECNPAARIAYLYRMAPEIAAARRRILSGELGAIRTAAFRIAATGGQAAWKHRRAEGGGALNELASHMIDLALWFFGDIESATLLDSTCRLPRRTIAGREEACDAEDHVTFRLDFRSGVIATIEADFAAPRFAQELTIEGAHNSLRASILSAGDLDLYAMQAQAFLDAIAAPEAANPLCTLREAASTARILDELRR